MLDLAGFSAMEFSTFCASNALEHFAEISTRVLSFVLNSTLEKIELKRTLTLAGLASQQFQRPS